MMVNALAAEDSFDGGNELAVTGALRAAVTPENGFIAMSTDSAV